MTGEPYRLTATEVLRKIKAGELTVEAYARSLLARISDRDEAVQAWAYLDKDYVIKQAKALDEVPSSERGPLHGVAIAVKDVIYTKDMPTQFNSPIYADDIPRVDAGSVAILRKSGALILGKTTTTEFAATTVGPKSRSLHDPNRTPGGSSSGSGAAVGDVQAPIGLGTQTGGSTIRPGPYNGIYALKPNWNSITREGQKIYSLILTLFHLGQPRRQRAAASRRATRHKTDGRNGLNLGGSRKEEANHLIRSAESFVACASHAKKPGFYVRPLRFFWHSMALGNKNVRK